MVEGRLNQRDHRRQLTIITAGPGLGGTTYPTNNPNAVDTFQIRILRR